eukprot:TRINITY_DN30103_c0_g1_i1.p1 TRINITY_DN30103_c0_g1~~TRINITY_DN30103_c0_g1_i1.p1  ORF type:complete len:350 (+),score=75.28 TRINITY_DN30103_c0_g1_i1:251-1300(+)
MDRATRGVKGSDAKPPNPKSFYTVLGMIGSGSCGSCDLVRSKRDGCTYVMKKIDIARCYPAEKKASFQEVKLLQKLRHPNIVAYRDGFVHKNKELYIVMQRCEGGDLFSQITKRRKPFEEEVVWMWFAQMSLSLHYLHKRKILHRDIKPQNVFLTKDLMVKLGDFGVAKILDRAESLAVTTVGTPYYMSPEVFKCKPYSYKSDCWALGCVLYEMMCLHRPFEARDIEGLKKKVCEGVPEAPLPEVYSEELRDLVHALLSVDPRDRPRPSQLLLAPAMQQHIKHFAREVMRQAGRPATAQASGRLEERYQAILQLLEGEFVEAVAVADILNQEELHKACLLYTSPSPRDS